MAKQKKIKQLTNDELRARFKGRLVRFKDAMGVEYRGMMVDLCDKTNMVTIHHKQVPYKIPKNRVSWV